MGASNRARAAVPPAVTLHLDSVSHAGVGTYITGACAAATITRVSTEDNAPETSAARRLVNAGSDLAGSGTAAALGMLVGGPIGAFAGAAAGPLLTHTLKELVSRNDDSFTRQCSISPGQGLNSRKAHPITRH